MIASDWLTARPIAHRGLHDGGEIVPENTLGAFNAAMKHGYAIECDLQPSGDGVPMVFHDFALHRLLGCDGSVTDLKATELGACAVLGTDQGVPTLSSLLATVAGNVPLVLELKGPQADPRAFVGAVAKALESYAGDAAVMSFDHEIVRHFAELTPERPRGLTAEGGDDTQATHSRVYEQADLQFLSYDVNALPCRFVEAVRKHGHPVITWTVRTAEQVAATATYADQMTFEGFLPDVG